MEGALPVCKGGSAVTVWALEASASNLPIFYFRMEGGVLTTDEREKVLDYYRSDIASNQAFATIYDMTMGLHQFSDHIVPFAKFCNDMRPITRERLQFTVAVCPSALYRTFISLILKLAPCPAPFILVSSREEVWTALEEATAATGTPLPWRGESCNGAPSQPAS